MNKTDRKIAPVYMVASEEMILDLPVKEAWPHVFNYWTWNDFSVRQHVSGEPGQEGEVVLLKKDEEGFALPPYFARLIKIEPEKRVIAKIWPEKRTEEVDFFGIVEFRVYPHGNQTRFCGNTIYEFLVPYRHESELDAYRELQDENFARLRSTTWPKLKKLCQR